MSPGMLTAHAAMRMAQRGFRRDDIDLVRLLGTEVDDGYLLAERDCAVFVREMKHLIAQVERLCGTRIVADGEVLVTAYRTTPRKSRRLMRTVQDRDLVLV